MVSYLTLSNLYKQVGTTIDSITNCFGIRIEINCYLKRCAFTFESEMIDYHLGDRITANVSIARLCHRMRAFLFLLEPSDRQVPTGSD